MAKLHKFPPMLGPAEEHPIGSVEWAERISNRLQISTQSVERSTSHHIGENIKAIWKATPKPWEIWPKGKPFGTPEDYCRAVTGHSWKALVETVKELTGDRSLERVVTPEAMMAENARAQAEARVQGAHHANGMMKQGSNQSAYLLRRLAREAPDVLDRYERGEFKSVRAAAREARIVKEPTPFEQITRLIPKLSAKERRALRDLLEK